MKKYFIQPCYMKHDYTRYHMLIGLSRRMRFGRPQDRGEHDCKHDQK